MERDEGALLLEFESLLELPAGTVDVDADLTTLEAWDSMAEVSFMAWADETRNIVITEEMLQTSKTVGDLLRWLL
jgi:acyl carrier protein